MRWAYGVAAHMIHVPVSLTFEEKPDAFGSYGHMSIQCGGSVIGVPLAAQGSSAPTTPRD